MISRTSFLFIIAFIAASLITLALCISSIYLLQFASPEFFMNLNGIVVLIGYGLLAFSAYLSVTRLIALYNGKESGAKFFFFIALIITVIFLIYFLSTGIKGIPLLLILLLLITWSLYKLYKSFPDEHIEDNYVEL
jgi:hypothetical protein